MERAKLIALVRAAGCAVERGGMFFLGDEKARADIEHRALTARGGELFEQGWLGIATGGSSGTRKFARHDEGTLTAAVRGFCAHFGITRVNAIDVLPAYHVSGLMARVRCAETGGRHVAWEWKRLEAGDRPMLTEARDGWVISLVPTQLQRLLGAAEAVAWLRGFKIIFVGGGPVWPELAEAAARERLPVSLSYGMTETAAMVAALKPEEFLAGARSCGRALPHVTIDFFGDVGRVPSHAEGNEMRVEGTPPTGGDEEGGVVRIAGESVFRGYWPESLTTREFVTEDLGRLDERGHLQILGRRDAVIISGGKKVQPAEVEAALRATGEFADVAVIGVPDAEWGEAVVACYPKRGRVPDLEKVGEVINRHLAGHHRPKRFVAIAEWPRNAQGKINRTELKRIAVIE